MFRCPRCHMHFSWAKSLKRHINTMHVPAEYQCSACKRTFNRKDSFDRHKRNMHKGHSLYGAAIVNLKSVTEPHNFHKYCMEPHDFCHY